MARKKKPVPTSDVPSFRDDIAAYHNPELLDNPLLPQRYKLYLRTRYSSAPYMVEIELDGDALPASLRENMLGLAHLCGAPLTNLIAMLGVSDDAELLRFAMSVDDECLALESRMRKFFLRNFPKLMVHAYNIVATTSVVSAAATLFDQPKSNGRNKLVKKCIDDLILDLRNDLHRMFEISASESLTDRTNTDLPALVRKVIQTSQEMIGKGRRRKPVPPLKAIAKELRMSTDSLAKQLRTVGHPWSKIKSDLRAIVEKSK